MAAAEHGVRCLLPFDPHQLKRPANHPSFNAALNLRSRGQWDGTRTGYAYDRFVRIPAGRGGAGGASGRPVCDRRAVVNAAGNWSPAARAYFERVQRGDLRG
jgi:hypothetical protein